MLERTEKPSRWVKLKFHALSLVFSVRKKGIERAYRDIRRREASLEKVHRPIRVLLSENMWLINGDPKDRTAAGAAQSSPKLG